jgi:predicted nuclease of predicted toxin-antitoxin system
MAEQVRLRFFLDNCVPDSVGKMLEAAGHVVILMREQMAPDSSDPVVAMASEINDAILVTSDKDFRAVAPRVGVGRNRFKRLSRLQICCPEFQAAKRIEVALSMIEHEWRVMQTGPDKRMIIEVGLSYIRTHR